MRHIIIALPLLLSACAPHLTFANEAGGVVNRTGSVGTSRAFALAGESCAKYGKVARITGNDILTATTRFDCVAR